MKACELMIGDWVFLNGKPMRVACLLNGKFINCGEPIPITEEILKMNGIPTNGDTHLFDTDRNYYLELQWEDGKLWWTINLAEYCIMPFAYVHELQHALRLCGLNELADNFKVGGEE